MFVIFVRH